MVYSIPFSVPGGLAGLIVDHGFQFTKYLSTVSLNLMYLKFDSESSFFVFSFFLLSLRSIYPLGPGLSIINLLTI